MRRTVLLALLAAPALAQNPSAADAARAATAAMNSSMAGAGDAMRASSDVARSVLESRSKAAELKIQQGWLDLARQQAQQQNTHGLNSQAEADGAPKRTDGCFNGRAWNVLPREGKLAYIMGFVDGMFASPVAGEWRKYYAAPSTFAEYADGVDEIYRKPENAALPISAVMQVFALKVKGASPAEVEDALAAGRKWLAENPPAAAK